MTVTSDPIGAMKRRARREGWASAIRSTADERAALDGCYFSNERADHAADFIPKFCCHSKGEFAGKPFDLLPWQRDDVIRPLFGWLRVDGRRRFRRTFISCPKKNGKSALASAVGLYLFVGDGEAGAEVYSAACDRTQASITHGEAVRMVESSPELSDAIELNRATFQLTHRATGSWYRALSSENRTKEGLNAHGLIIDELHVWTRAYWNVLRYASASRRQPLAFCITTSGDDPLSVAYEQDQYARGIMSGTHTDHAFFPFIREASAEDDPADPATWEKANPSFGVTIHADEMAESVAEAQKTPTAMASFLRYRLNRWGVSETAWLHAADWNECQTDDADEFLASLEGQTCFAGLDLSRTRDTTSLQLIFPQDEGRFSLLSFFWLPRASAEAMDTLVPYLTWAQQGFIKLTDGDVCDYSTVEADIAALAKRFSITSMAFDPWHAEELSQRLESIHGIPRTAFPQSAANFTGPVDEFERLVIARFIEHAGHPVQSWQIQNARIKPSTNSAKRIVKASSTDVRKVDGVVAAVMALGLALQKPEESVYQSQGLFTLNGNPFDRRERGWR